jgi:hypothetical protein
VGNLNKLFVALVAGVKDARVTSNDRHQSLLEHFLRIGLANLVSHVTSLKLIELILGPKHGRVERRRKNVKVRLPLRVFALEVLVNHDENKRTPRVQSRDIILVGLVQVKHIWDLLR